MANQNQLWKAYVWSQYFAGVTSFQYHPRNPAADRLTIQECAAIADAMWEQFRQRFPEDQTWHG